MARSRRGLVEFPGADLELATGPSICQPNCDQIMCARIRRDAADRQTSDANIRFDQAAQGVEAGDTHFELDRPASVPSSFQECGLDGTALCESNLVVVERIYIVD